MTNAIGYGAVGIVELLKPYLLLERTDLPKLYQVAYRSRQDGSIVKCNGFNDRDTAEQIARSFNVRYGHDYEYFVLEVNLKSLSERQLLELAQDGKLTAA